MLFGTDQLPSEVWLQNLCQAGDTRMETPGLIFDNALQFMNLSYTKS